MAKTTDQRLDELFQLMNKMENQQQENTKNLEKRFAKFEKSMDFISNQFDDHKKIVENVLKANSEIKKENESLRKEMQKLKEEIYQARKDTDNLEQYGRRDTIEISGIPRENGEDSTALVLKVGKAIGVECDGEDIEACHRIGPKKDAAIICKFQSRKMKSEFMRRKKELKNVNSKDLEVETPKPLKIFINESLTKMNKELFRLVRERKKEMNWQFAWTRNGVVYARKNKDADVVRIGSPKDIEQKLV